MLETKEGRTSSSTKYGSGSRTTSDLRTKRRRWRCPSFFRVENMLGNQIERFFANTKARPTPLLSKLTEGRLGAAENAGHNHPLRPSRKAGWPLENRFP